MENLRDFRDSDRRMPGVVRRVTKIADSPYRREFGGNVISPDDRQETRGTVRENRLASRPR